MAFEEMYLLKGENCWRLHSQAENEKEKKTHENDIIALLENSFSPIVEINSVVIKHVFIQII